MTFDSTMLARIAADLRRLALGARVVRVFPAARDEIVLELRRKLPRPQIVLCWSSEFGRAHLAGAAEPRPDLHLAIGDVLRKHLRGATLTDCRQIEFDRVVHLEFANCVGLGPESRATLVAEIMGRHSNLILLTEDRTIIACAKHVTAEVNRYREVLPGLEYVPPPSFERMDPHGVTAEQLAVAAAQRQHESPRKFLRNTLVGGSDLFLDEVTTRAKLDPAAPLADQPEGWPEAVATALSDILHEAEMEAPAFIYAPPEDMPSWAGSPNGARNAFAYPLVLQSRTDLDSSRTEDLSEALEILVNSKQTTRLIHARRQRLSGFALRALKKALAKEEHRQRSLAQAEQADELRKRGELILANLHVIRPGDSEATVTDYYDPEQPQIVLQLDPNYSAKENAQALFNRYKRARRIQERVPGLLRRARIEREYLEGLLEQVETADTIEELDELEAELERAGHIGHQAKAQRRPPRVPATEPRRAQSSDGYAILYGKTGSQNDALVRMADGDDLWFHVKTGPGAHVLIRAAGRPDDVPQRTIIEAAAIAAANSRWRTDARADVNYTLAKHVRKPRNAPPGFVTYTNFKTITVEPRAPSA